MNLEQNLRAILSRLPPDQSKSLREVLNDALESKRKLEEDPDFNKIEQAKNVYDLLHRALPGLGARAIVNIHYKRRHGEMLSATVLRYYGMLADLRTETEDNIAESVEVPRFWRLLLRRNPIFGEISRTYRETMDIMEARETSAKEVWQRMYPNRSFESYVITK